MSDQHQVPDVHVVEALFLEGVHRLVDDGLAGRLDAQVPVDLVDVVTRGAGGVDALDLDHVAEGRPLGVEDELLAVVEGLLADDDPGDLLDSLEHDVTKLLDELEQFAVAGFGGTELD